MPSPTTKNRQALKSRFVRGAIPTETDFSDLIGAGLNQAEDGVYKLPNEPLSLVRQKPDQPALRFYEDPAADGSAWQITLADQGVAGFGIANNEGKTSLFIDKATGNLGIGTNTPKQALHVNGTAAITTLYADEVWIAGKKVGADHGLAGNITVLPNGNVGIGTTTPAQRLSVEGSVGISSTLTRGIWAKSDNGPWDKTLNGRIASRTLRIYKQFSDTALRIAYHDNAFWNFQTFEWAGHVWEVRIDGIPLKRPIIRMIGHLMQSNVAAPVSLIGYATMIPAGEHEIQIWVWPIQQYAANLGTGGGMSGSISTWSLEAEEVWMK